MLLAVRSLHEQLRIVIANKQERSYEVVGLDDGLDARSRRRISPMNAAIETLTRGLALELAPIRVNAVAPGTIDIPLLGEHREGAAKWVDAALPVKRMGLAEEVAQAVVLLMTNGFMTGEVVHIDGGGRLV